MQSCIRIITIIYKELMVLLENRQSRLMLIVPPLMQIIIFAWAATMEVRNVDVAVLNQDTGRWSREIIQRVSGSPTFTHIFYLRGQNDVRPALDTRQALCVLVFDAEFSRKVERGEPAEFQVLLDGRRSNAAQITASYLAEIVAGAAETTPAAATALRAGGLPAVTLTPRFWFNPNLEFRWFFLPNLVGMVSFVLSLVITGLSVAREREMGTFDQLQVSPASATEIAIAKLLPGGIVGLVHATLFLFIVHWGFGVPLVGSAALFYAAMLLFTLASSGMGLMISSLCATQQQAFLGAFALAVPCILISGTITPVSNMPDFLQWLSAITPIRHFLVLTQGIFLKGLSMQAAFDSAWRIAVIAAVCATVSVWMFRRKL